MRYLCLLLCVFALFPSCKESEKDKIARLVEEWEGKEILFPTHSIFTIQGKDTVDFSLADADYNVVLSYLSGGNRRQREPDGSTLNQLPA